MEVMLEDFGQRVDLTRRIREVLVNYPEGTTVLKELIQNADDAGATTVKLCLDRRYHGTDSLLSPALAQWQGPALLAYNDAVFTKDDFVGISRIGDSKKQGQAWKTGRFGVGFNSVYHLTDLPSFVSDEYVVIFDPHGAYLPNVSAANPGKRLNYVSSSATSLYKHQFDPYHAFGCDMERPFCGSLFRFPLRSEDQAVVSKLSRQAYLEFDISSMFSQLYKEAALILLFLKNVTSIEMCVWEADMDEPKKIYSCSICTKDNITWHRQAILRFNNAEPSRLIDTYLVDILSEEGLDKIIEKRIDTFFIAQGLTSTSSKIDTFVATAAKEYDIQLLPWASVAACISDDLPEDSILRHGHAFCFLPLPVRTGLTVHVNGYFEVASNRRSIWYGDDMDRGGKLRSDWNKLLLEEIVAPMFVELLLGVRMLIGPSLLFYSLWPSGSFEEPWSLLVKQFYRSVILSPLFYSKIGGGKWLSLFGSFIHDEVFMNSDLDEALILLEMPVVHLPRVLVEMLAALYFNIFHHMLVSPVTVRSFLKRCKTQMKLRRSYMLVLLEYCLSDLNAADVGKHANGLLLIPLANGEFGIFGEESQGVPYFICNDMEYKLLSLSTDRLIDRSIPASIFHSLSEVAKSCKANINFLDGKSFLQFFPKFFPSEWRFKRSAYWHPESSVTLPTRAWFMLFWQYLCVMNYDLSIFSEWPILPSTSGHLYKACESSKLLVADLLTDTMKELLTKIGCKLLNFEFEIKHQELHCYLYECNAAGVLNSIFDCVGSSFVQLEMIFRDVLFDERNELRLFLLDSKWYYGGIFSDVHIKLCRKLPIFRIYGERDNHTHFFSDLESSQNYLPPANIPEYLLNSEFIFCASNLEEDILIKYYGIVPMQKVIFYKRNILNRLSELEPQVRDKVMISILQDLPQLCFDDFSFRESLTILRFVPTASGLLETPQSLYDPRVEELKALLEGSDCFPCGLFQESTILDMLLCVGLMTAVSTDTILKSARQIESLMHKDPLRANLHGKVLLTYLEVNASKWLPKPSNGMGDAMFSRVATKGKLFDVPRDGDLGRFWHDLKTISWCPVLVTSPHSALPWPSISSTVAPPKQVRVCDDMWLVSASIRILDGECSSSALSHGLGWACPPSGSIIAAQLLELGKNNEIVTDKLLRQELALAMPKLYSLLHSMIISDEMDIIRAVLEGSRWVWVGDGFATVDEVVLRGHLHFTPYIRVVPVDLEVFKELFLELGVKECLRLPDYANILFRMATRKCNVPLEAKELTTVFLVVQNLAEAQVQDLCVQIYLPDASSRLFPANELVFNDAPWLLDIGDRDFVNTIATSLNSKKNAHKYVHGNISNNIAEKLGARSLRRLLLAESSDSMNISLSGVAEAFGQHEALTTRLKHIVDMYADGPGILFELVQNAEDALASEVIFLLDKTQYGTSSILSPEMAKWQGPALYCYNNSVFTSQDLYAISRIGQDNKLDKPLSIGRFGLGFNCVYHFTDIPSFVSGENIVFFDPHACYLPGISPTHPGLKIRFVERRILDQFPDQFTPFLHFGCDLQQAFPGTLFRFPLRGESAASRSEIKPEIYSPEDVESLFLSFSGVLSEALLFLRNVKKISIFVKDGAGYESRLVHCVSRSHVSGLSEEPHMHLPMLNFIRGNMRNCMDRDQFLNKLAKIEDKDLPWECQKVAILQHIPGSVVLHFWIVSECLGGGFAKSRSIAMANRPQNLIPWASVAAYLVSINLDNVKEADDASYVEELYVNAAVQDQNPFSVKHKNEFVGKAFCFLPLPITTGLPVHINAYFELSSNRRDIWFGTDMTGGGRERSEWNSCLLQDVVSLAYGRLLAATAKEIGPCDLFFSFWPTVIGDKPWATMIQKLYLSVVDLELSALYTNAREGKWISTRQAIFPDFTFPKANELSEALSEAGLPIITVSKQMTERFMEVQSLLHFLSPQMLRILLIRRKREFKSKDAMMVALAYCLNDITGDDFSSSFHGLPLVPLANGSFSSLRKREGGEKIYVAGQKEYDLIKESVPHLLVDNSIPADVFQKLQDIAYLNLSNLFCFSCFSLVELFPRILPSEWHRCKRANWSPGLDGQPSLSWMGMLWSYLKESCNDLSIFLDWPILPVSSDYLFQLAESSVVIRNEGWSENLHLVLQKLGCFFLRSDYSLDHPQLKYFVQDATARGILNAIQASCQIQDINNLFSNASKSEMNELRSFILQSKWFSGGQMTSEHIDMIKMLPIFACYGSRDLTNLVCPTKWLKPEGIHEDVLCEDFILTESDRERSILTFYLGLKEISKSNFYKEYALKNMSKFLLHPDLLYSIILGMKVLIEQDSSFESELLESNFVLSAHGDWKHPSRLYDPRMTGLQTLLHKEYFFPCDKFVNDEMLDALVILGLKRNLGFSALLDVARSASIMQSSGDERSLIYSRRLFVYLNAVGHKLTDNSEDKVHEFRNPVQHNGDILDNKVVEVNNHKCECCECECDLLSFLGDFIYDMPEVEFWSELKTISWCPVCVKPPIEGLPWFISDDHLASPSITRPKAQMWIASSKFRILNGECCSNYLERKLGWMNPPRLQVLSSQLIELSKSYHLLKLHSERESLIDISLEREIPRIYSVLQEYAANNDISDLKSSLHDVPWIWIGDNFVPPNLLAFDSPVKYHPYLYVVPSELSEFRYLLLKLGVKLTFDSNDYLRVLQCLECDLKGMPLSSEQLNFVQRVLDAFADCFRDKQVPDAYLRSLLIPDSFGILSRSSCLVYNDAPWMEKNISTEKQFVHPSISNHLAGLLGVQSLRSLAFVDEVLMNDLPCMDYPKISEFLALYGGKDGIIFDLLELADCCKAKTLHVIYDKREHPQQYLLQHNLGEFQGCSLTVVLEGVTLSREEVCNLHSPPPWKIRGSALNYGLGLISSYFICDLLEIISGGYFYIFDPLGLVLTSPAICSPSAKLFSLTGSDLTNRFHDQFSPMLISENLFVTKDSTIIRMPLSSKCMNEPGSGCKRVKQIFQHIIHHSSSILLFLKSVCQVSLLIWEEGNLNPTLDYSLSIDPGFAVMRNPFSQKEWRKFQISRLFGSPNATVKIQTIDVQVVLHGTCFVDKWLIALCLGSGQTRNMALDRRYLAYNLTPIAGVAACISSNSEPVKMSSCILSPLPLSGAISLPVTVLGCFLVCHNSGRCLFDHPNEMDFSGQHIDSAIQLIRCWNKELMLCIRDSYVEMVLELQKLRIEPLSSTMDSASTHPMVPILHTYGDNRIYSFWPRSSQVSGCCDQDHPDVCDLNPVKTSRDWVSVVEQVIRPFYASLVKLPVWQLYGGSLVKANEGMFLSPPLGEEANSLQLESVCNFIKEHYPVFSVPWELVSEIQAVGIQAKEINPRMVRGLLKDSHSISIRSIESYLDVLGYCLSDIQLDKSEVVTSNFSGENIGYGVMNSLQNNTSNLSSHVSLTSVVKFNNSYRGSDHSGVDAIERMSNIGRALYDFGRSFVEDTGTVGDSFSQRAASGGNMMYAEQMLQFIAGELKGIPFPTSSKCLKRLGTFELWVTTKEQQLLMHPFAEKLIHLQCLGKPFLSEILSNQTIQEVLLVKTLSPHLLSSHLKFLLSESWVNHVTYSSEIPWISWGGEGSRDDGPNTEWLHLFWNVFCGLKGDLSLLFDWHLIPAFLSGPVLCLVRERNLIFMPPIFSPNDFLDTSPSDNEGPGMLVPTECIFVESKFANPHFVAFEKTKMEHPWLLPLLNQFNIPVFDMSFIDKISLWEILPEDSQSLGKVVLSKLLATKRAGYFSMPDHFLDEDRDSLFSLFESDFKSTIEYNYKHEELEVLRELPIYKTVLGTYTKLFGEEQCVIPCTAFFHPMDELCLSNTVDETSFVQALGIKKLDGKDLLVRFALPGFERKSFEVQENILLYLHTNWNDLQADAAILDALKGSNFVKNARENCGLFFKPKDLLDPHDSLLTSVFSGEGDRFPSERFCTDEWLHILRKTGLRTSSQEDMLVECAKKVEFLGTQAIAYNDDIDDFEAEFSGNQREISFELWSLAESIIESIFNNFANLYTNSFCEMLSNIAFVPAMRGFPSIVGMKGAKRLLSSYKDAIILKDWPLAWSSAPIISKKNVLPPEYAWGAFHLRTPPAFSTVLKHLQVLGRCNGEDVLARWPASSIVMSIESATLEILSYLDKIWGTLSLSDISDLGKIAFLPVANGTRLVTPGSLFVRLTINLSPFAFEVPNLYLPFVKILKEIGMHEVFSIQTARDFLFAIQKSCGYQRLNPNELRAVLEILRAIHAASQEQSIEADLLHDTIVPDDGCRLISSSLCVYVDLHGSRFLGKIDTSRLRFAHPDLTENICMGLGIKKLSDVVVEELDDEHQLEVIEQIGSVTVNHIVQKLLCKSFQDTMLIMINSLANNFPSFEGVTSMQIQNMLQAISEKLQFVERLHTVFLLLPKYLNITRITKCSSIPEWSDSSRHQAVYFVNKSRSCVLIANPPRYMSVYDVLAVTISQVLCTPTTLPIGTIFSCPIGSEREILNVLKLDSTGCIAKPEGWNTVLIGNELLPQDALLVQLFPLRPFYAGEFVAWRTTKDQEKLRYGRVLYDVRPSAGQGLYRFHVEITPGDIKVLLSSQVFSFRSVSLDKTGSTSLFVKDNICINNGEGTHKQSSSMPESGQKSQQVINNLLCGRVSPKDLMKAVHDMLSSAGIDVDAEKERLLQTTLTIQEQLRESQISLLVQQEKTDAAVREAETAKAAWSCRICLNAEVDTTIVPCGHVLCHACVAAVSNCPFCRERISRIVKLFRP